MKNTILAAAAGVALMVCGAGAGLAQDRSKAVIRYRDHTMLTFDANSGIKEEDAQWTLTSAQMGKLSTLQSGTVVMGTNTLSTNVFSPAFSVSPVVLTSSGPGSNRLDYVQSVTTSNMVIGSAATNATIYWMAFGKP
jgi:hypothetical protein